MWRTATRRPQAAHAPILIGNMSIPAIRLDLCRRMASRRGYRCYSAQEKHAPADCEPQQLLNRVPGVADQIIGRGAPYYCGPPGRRPPDHQTTSTGCPRNNRKCV
jgi:hypothetical protein